MPADVSRLGHVKRQQAKIPPGSAIGQARYIGHFGAGLTDVLGLSEPHGFGAWPRQRRGDRDLGSPPERRAYCERRAAGVATEPRGSASRPISPDLLVSAAVASDGG